MVEGSLSKDIEDFYPLSPMQQGMLFHSVLAPESGVYIEIVSCALRGRFNQGSFEKAWTELMSRHQILRTAFMGQGLKEPVQAVYKNVALPVKNLDWREHSPADQKARLAQLLDFEQNRGFDLAKPPLMRFKLIRLDEDTHQFVWTYHHILMDGWSLATLFQEFLVLYESLERGLAVELPPVRPYRDYIVWLKKQDSAQAETFWRRVLDGFRSPTKLIVDSGQVSAEPDDTKYGEEELELAVDVTDALNDLCRRHQLTANTLVQGAWAILLGRFSGEDDVVFGSTVSGRPAELSGVESMIGLFINTLPVRVGLPGNTAVLAWVKKLQEHLVEMRQYEYKAFFC